MGTTTNAEVDVVANLVVAEVEHKVPTITKTGPAETAINIKLVVVTCR